MQATMCKRLFVVLAAWLLAASAWAQTGPSEFVEQLTKQVIEQIRQDKTIKEGDLGRISEFVDRTIMPHVNFERMTALAVGRGWRDASPEQKKRLMEEFRTLLLRTYAGALTAVGDQEVRMRPMRGDPKDTNVIVRSEIIQRRGDPIQLDYRLEKAGEGWKIYDMNVLGVWLVETYRSQFAQELSRGGVDGLIKSLATRNAQAK